MPRDTPIVTPAKPVGMAAMAARFSKQVRDFGADYDVPLIPRPDTSLPRSVRTMPVPDLSGAIKAWLLIGPGGAGKTMLARWIGGELIGRNMTDRCIMAALDPTNRSLAQFFELVFQPEDSDPARVSGFVQQAFAELAANRFHGVIDFGGGDLSMARVIDGTPRLVEALEAEGIAPIAVYVLTPRLDDLTTLATFEARGFSPRATLLVLNLAKAESPAAFDGIRGLPAYRAALARGAVEVWMPAMPQPVALAIEHARVQFREAQDGTAPDGRKPAPLSMFERPHVRQWLDAMAAEFSVVETWLPWA